MNLETLSVNCPSCGSHDVTYSCAPECCFNHVCGSCLAGFELATRDLGGTAGEVSVAAADRDSCSPTVPCARCRSLDVYQARGQAAPVLVCAGCRALLELEFVD